MYNMLLPETGWLYEDVNEYELYGITRDDTCEFNKRKSVTHVSVGRVDGSQDPEDEDTTKFTSHFCFPFEYQFMAKDTHCKKKEEEKEKIDIFKFILKTLYVTLYVFI